MVLELLHNIAFLIALSVGLQVLGQRLPTEGLRFRLLAGLLFGGVAVVGMMTPVHFAPGIIYDGRSIVLSLAAWWGASQCCHRCAHCGQLSTLARRGRCSRRDGRRPRSGDSRLAALVPPAA
jgi:hypothetical protein